VLNKSNFFQKVTEEGRDQMRKYMRREVFKVGRGVKVPEKDIQMIFQAFDKDFSGIITNKEFKDAAQSFGLDPNSQEIELLVKIFDENRDGCVSFAEFVHFVNSGVDMQGPVDVSEDKVARSLI
jgi:Ca2+-binding EF-hand superfamily protein